MNHLPNEDEGVWVTFLVNWTGPPKPSRLPEMCNLFPSLSTSASSTVLICDVTGLLNARTVKIGVKIVQGRRSMPRYKQLTESAWRLFTRISNQGAIVFDLCLGVGAATEAWPLKYRLWKLARCHMNTECIALMKPPLMKESAKEMLNVE